ncbi:hypothetical protein [Ralstonia pseudosolanacearum]
MSDFLKTIGTLHTLDKLGEQGRTIDRQGRALDRMGDALDEANSDIGKEKAAKSFYKNEAEKYKDLLSRPMHVIAEQSGAFKETYEKQQEMLADWIVSQRAFRELAMKYGKLVGKTPEEIKAEGMAAKEIILQGQSQFDNDVNEETKVVAKRKQAREEKAGKVA